MRKARDSRGRKPRAKARSSKRAAARPAAAKLGELIAKDSRVLALLDKHGITFCAGCFLTLLSSPERAAVYHAVPQPKKFLAELEALLNRPR